MTSPKIKHIEKWGKSKFDRVDKLHNQGLYQEIAALNNEIKRLEKELNIAKADLEADRQLRLKHHIKAFRYSAEDSIRVFIEKNPVREIYVVSAEIGDFVVDTNVSEEFLNDYRRINDQECLSSVLTEFILEEISPVIRKKVFDALKPTKEPRDA